MIITSAFNKMCSIVFEHLIMAVFSKWLIQFLIIC